MTEQEFRRLLAETKDSARTISGQSHVSADAKKCMQDFLYLADGFDRALNSRTDTSGELRMLRKNFENLKVENNAAKKKIEKFADFVKTELAPILKTISTETALIESKENSDASVKTACANIKTALREFVERLTKI